MNRFGFDGKLGPALALWLLTACGTAATPTPAATTDDAADAALSLDIGAGATDAAADTAPDGAAEPDVAAKPDAAADVAATPDVPPAKDVAADTAPDAATTPDVPDAAAEVADAVVDANPPDVASADVPAVDAAGDTTDATSGPTVAGCASGLIWQNGKCGTSTAALHAGDAETVTGSTVTLYLTPPGNLLVNGGAETGDLSGWTVTNGGDPWQVGSGSAAAFGGRYFRGSYAWGYLAQTVDLLAAGVNAADLDAGIPLHFSLFGIGWGFTSSAGKLDTIRLDVAFQDATGTQLGTWSSGDITLAVGAWGVGAVDTTTYPVGTRKAVVTLGSIDGEYWAGNYGPTVDGGNLSVGALDIRISNGDGVWSAWQPFSASVSGWALTAGAGAKTVQVEFRDGTGTSLGIVTDTVTAQ